MSLDAGWPRVETWMALVRGSAPNMASDDVAGIILCVQTQRVAGGESHAGREGPEPRGTWRRDGERGRRRRRRRRRRVLELELAQPFRDLVGRPVAPHGAGGTAPGWDREVATIPRRAPDAENGGAGGRWLEPDTRGAVADRGRAGRCCHQ